MPYTNCTLNAHLRIVEANYSDYEQLAHYHYQSGSIGPIRRIFKLIDDSSHRQLEMTVVGVIVYGAPSANLATRNLATDRMFCGLDRSATLALLNDQMVCIRRVIIEPRYRGLGLASHLVAQTLPLIDSPMVEAISMMGHVHPFFERAGMKAFSPRPDAKTERMKAALDTAGLADICNEHPDEVHAAIEKLQQHMREFIDDEMNRFCQKFTNRRWMAPCRERTDFVLSKLSKQPLYYLWKNPQYEKDL